MSTPVIETRDLCKRYGSVAAVDGLTLSIDAGTVFGLLGPNGSGKTTTILMLMGLTEVTSGTVRVVGYDPVRNPLQVKRLVGYMPDAVGFYDQMTARENLRFTGRLAGIPRDELEKRITDAIERVDLGPVADRRVAIFSRGMRQRLGLADVLLKRPRVAILDEPTSGLDPQSTHELLDLIVQLKGEGLTILLSSHLLDRVQAVCDRVGLFYRGRMVLEGAVPDLARKVLGGGYRITVEARGKDLEQIFQRVSGVTRVERVTEGTFALAAEHDVRPAVAAAVAGARCDLLGLSAHMPTLDEIYTTYFRELDHAA
jgi:ABC-2 type transport system ATP-binding protein